jgi:hypothetical protein
MNLSDHFDAISFSGCGTLNFYQCGVAYALQQYGLPEDMHYAGSSAGAGLGVLLAQGSDASEIASVAVDILKRHQHANILYRSDVLLEFANGFLGHFLDLDTLPKIGNRVSISLTRVPSIKNVMVNTFHDLSDLGAAVRASCHIPSRQLRTVRFRHMRCMDGGFSNNSPILTPKTLRVSPFFFDARADIFPSPKVTPWWAVKVPSPAKAWEFFEQGEKDAVALLQKIQNEGLIISSKTVDSAATSTSGTRFPMQAVLQSLQEAPSS